VEVERVTVETLLENASPKRKVIEIDSVKQTQNLDDKDVEFRTSPSP